MSTLAHVTCAFTKTEGMMDLYVSLFLCFSRCLCAATK